MPPRVNSFFLTKIAKDDPNKIVDPGEAAAAGLAIGTHPIATKVLPIGGSYLAGRWTAPPVPWLGQPMYGLGEGGISTPDKILKGMNKVPRIMNLFKVRPLDPGGIVEGKFKRIRGAVDPQQVQVLQESLKSADQMMKKYDLYKKKVKFDIVKGPLSRLTGPSFDSSTKRIKMPWIDKDYFLHEIGHAAHLTKPGARTLHGVRKAIKAGVGSAIPMAYLVGNEIQQMLPGKIDDKIISFVQENAPAIMAATWTASEIYPEVQATSRAVHHVYKTEGKKAAIKTLKRLLPPLASYVLPVIPAIVGLSLAKKYYFDAKKEEDVVKTANFLGGLYREVLAPTGEELASVAGQIAKQTGKLFRKEPKDVMQTLYRAGIKSAKSPEFVSGAIYAGIPAATWAYAIHNTHHGKLYRQKREALRVKSGQHPQQLADLQEHLAKQKDDSVTLPALVGLGAAVSGGFLNKFWSDIMRVL